MPLGPPLAQRSGILVRERTSAARPVRSHQRVPLRRDPVTGPVILVQQWPRRASPKPRGPIDNVVRHRTHDTAADSSLSRGIARSSRRRPRPPSTVAEPSDDCRPRTTLVGPDPITRDDTAVVCEPASSPSTNVGPAARQSDAGVPQRIADDRTPVRVTRVAIADGTVRATFVRAALRRELDLDVVGVGATVEELSEILAETEVNVIVVDAEDPRLAPLIGSRELDAIATLGVVGSSSRPSAAAAVCALEAGALDVVPLASQLGGPNTELAVGELIDKIRVATRAKRATPRPPTVRPLTLPARFGTDANERVIVIGASTGGTEAIRTLLDDLPQASPPIVVVQHMPEGFTRTFAEHLDRSVALTVKHAEPGDRLVRGRVLVAPGDAHLRFVREGNEIVVRTSFGPKISGHRPSIDVLMRSAAELFGARAIGIVLTGMGRDGADGLLALREAGARTFAQDEATSVVFGMPRAAYENQGAERLVPLHELAARILGALASKAA